MILPRYYNNLSELVRPGKVLIIYGPRRSGKTTLLDLLLKGVDLKYRIDSGDSIRIRNLFGSEDLTLLQEYAEGYELIVIDEAQNIRGIGLALKILIDHIPGLKVIATGSSSFDLEQQTGEPLTGRKRVLILYPISILELSALMNRHELKAQLEHFLIYGSYPEVYTATSTTDKKELLQELVDSYLLKDILGFDRIRSPKQLIDLLKLLAFQIGQEVSVHELAKQVKLNERTVERYLYLLEKGFVIYRISAFSKNPRKEITKKSKFYFLDNGIRNGIILQFNSLDLRNDAGPLWENLLMSERRKSLHYNRIIANQYFWRNYQQQEVDYLEERDGKLTAYEFKWGKSKNSLPGGFESSYGNVDYYTINKNNYLDFLLSP